jgi:drug/metabolite transporter (DMT)-like permease
VTGDATPAQSSTAAGLLKVALAASSWGTWSLFLRPGGLPAEVTAPLTFLMIGLFTLPFIRVFPVAPRWDRRTWQLLGANTLLDSINLAAFFLAMSRTTVAVAVLTHYLAPVLVALLAPYVEKQRVAVALPAALLAVTGLTLVLAPWRTATIDPNMLLGAGLGTISAFAYAGNVFVIRRLAERIGAPRAQAYHSLLAAVLISPLALLVRGDVHLTPFSIGLLALGALVPGSLAGIVFVSGLRVIGAARASVLAYLEPLVAVAVGWLFWHEQLDALALLGGALVLSGGVLVARAPMRPVVVALASVLLLSTVLAPQSGSAQQRIAIADPAFGYLVEGHVLRADGRPAAGVQVERAETMNYVAESVVTDANGAFRFEGHGLGWGPGTRWTVTLRRAGCADVTRMITLRDGPIDGRAQDEARGVVLRLAMCRVDRAVRLTRTPSRR